MQQRSYCLEDWYFALVGLQENSVGFMVPMCDMVTKHHKGPWVVLNRQKKTIHCASKEKQPKTFWTFVPFDLSFHFLPNRKIRYKSPPSTNLHPTPALHTKKPVSSRNSRIAAYPGNIEAYRYVRQRLWEEHLSKKVNHFGNFYFTALQTKEWNCL